MAIPLPPVPNTILARLIFVLGDDANVENVQHFILPAGVFPLTPANCVTLANAIMTAWAATMVGSQCTAITLSQVQVVDLNTATGAEGNSTHAAVPGSVATAPVTAGAAGVCTLNTAFRGRSFRGRQFLAGCPQANTLDPQHWNNAFVTATNTNWAAYLSNLAGIAAPGPMTLSVVSYFSGKIANPNPLSKNRFIPQRRVTPLSTAVSQVVTKQRIGSQRRRNS